MFQIFVSTSLEDAVAGADCIILGTGHSEFKSLDFKVIASICRSPTAFVDAINAFRPEEPRKYGFSYVGVGRRLRG